MATRERAGSLVDQRRCGRTASSGEDQERGLRQRAWRRSRKRRRIRGSAHHLSVWSACLAARLMKVVATMRRFGRAGRRASGLNGRRDTLRWPPGSRRRFTRSTSLSGARQSRGEHVQQRERRASRGARYAVTVAVHACGAPIRPRSYRAETDTALHTAGPPDSQGDRHCWLESVSVLNVWPVRQVLAADRSVRDRVGSGSGNCPRRARPRWFAYGTAVVYVRRDVHRCPARYSEVASQRHLSMTMTTGLAGGTISGLS